MSLLNSESNEVLKQQLKRHEGIKNKPYLCTAGKRTIGVGRNLDAVGITTDEALYLLAEGITEDDAMYLLDNDIQRVEKELVSHVRIFPALSENRKIVLMNMSFNLGINGLLKFNNMFAALETLDYQKAADEMLDSLWAKQVGSRANELANIMISG
jgi:lysozyme